MGSQSGLESLGLAGPGWDLLVWRVVVGQRERADGPEEDPH